MIKSDIIIQDAISNKVVPILKNIFTSLEYVYFTHVINGLVHYNYNQFNSPMIQYGKKDENKGLHIFEPFHTLNSLSYATYTVTSIIFDQTGRIHFWGGYNNNIDLFSDQLERCSITELPIMNTSKTDFFHFVEQTGIPYDRLEDEYKVYDSYNPLEPLI
jgi:hypothetical protein